MSEYSDIFKFHPLLVLVSEKPATWYGFILVNKETRIETKLRVPHYPDLKGATVHFGEQICLLQRSEFKSKVRELLQNGTSVLSFLRQLQGLMEGIVGEKKDENLSKKHFFNTDMLKELSTVLNVPDVEVQGNDDLSAIKITYNSISIILKPETMASTPWGLVSSDLPHIPEWQPLEKCLSTLVEAIQTVKSRVDALEDTWHALADIDENCWVIDPVSPKPSHLYRRIHINAALSLLIKLNPLHSENYPEMKLLGSDKEVFKCNEILNENLSKWDPFKTIPENVMELLEIQELPLPPADKTRDDDAIFDDEECCICFSMESDDGDLPTEICSNEKCRKHFHSSCLLEWLQRVVGKQMYFERCHGTCPVCKENISCAVKVR